MSYDMNDLLDLMVEQGGSDLHLQVGQPPTLRLSDVDEYAETLMAQRISMVSGVAQVSVFGAQKYAVRAQLDKVAHCTLLGQASVPSIELAAKLVQAPGFYEGLTRAAKRLTEGLGAVAAKHGIPFCGQSIGSMFGVYFCKTPPTSYAEVMASDKAAFNRFFHAMLERGVSQLVSVNLDEAEGMVDAQSAA